ncbi:MAG: BCSC C-terminal domain-containing protein [Gammaproteobacteria bacterium]|nr:BCSC C-terminal domain-containing protein [Gammaproteobacteria bacterium]
MSAGARLAALCAGALVAAVAPSPGVAAPAAPAQSATSPAPSAAQTRPLLDSARLWRQRGRDDLAAAALRKLLAIAPQDRVALRLLLAIEIEAGRFDVAETLLARLARTWPGAAEIGELRELLAMARTQGRRAVRDRLRAIDTLPLASGALAARNAAPRERAAAPALHTAPPAAATSATSNAPAGASGQIAPGEPAPADAAADAATLARTRRAEADALAAHGNDAAARAALEDALQLDPASAWVRFDLARLLQRQRDPAAARTTIEAGLAQLPEDADMAFAAALFFSGIDADAAARSALARVPREHWSAGMTQLDTRLRVTQLLTAARERADAGDYAASQAALEQAGALASGDASALVRAGWAAQGVGDYHRSHRYFTAADSTARAAGDADESAAAHRGIDYLETLRQSFVTSGLEFNEKPGESGVSRFNRRIVPVELRWAFDYDRYLFAHADHLDLDAGRLDLSDFAAVANYGQLLAAGPPGPGGSLHPRASGVMPGIGYESGHWRIDVGHLPGGFPVSYAVGGLRYQSRLRGIDWSIDVARRPLSGTLIAFAGVRDPASGATWGGVRSSGVTLNGSRQLSRHDFYVRLGYYALSGRNVPGNSEAELRAGYDWFAAERGSQRLNVGTTLTAWRYARNQRFETFGQGGYYSPQGYLALSLPAQWSGIRDIWSWRLRVALAWSITHEDDTPYHPTDAALQAAAAAQAAASSLAPPIHAGGRGGGFSLAAAGAIECRIAEGWSLGARFQLDRSEDYSPDTVGLWIRYRFGGAGEPWSRPRAPRVYAYY